MLVLYNFSIASYIQCGIICPALYMMISRNHPLTDWSFGGEEVKCGASWKGVRVINGASGVCAKWQPERLLLL